MRCLVHEQQAAKGEMKMYRTAANSPRGMAIKIRKRNQITDINQPQAILTCGGGCPNGNIVIHNTYNYSRQSSLVEPLKPTPQQRPPLYNNYYTCITANKLGFHYNCVLTVISLLPVQ